MITIHLHNIKFRSFHGVLEEEKLSGNDFEVNADIQFHEEEEVIHSLSHTINYVDLFKIINERMQTPTPLLETVVMDIGKEISEKYNSVRSISISIKKMHPPIESLEGSVGITWNKEF